MPTEKGTKANFGNFCLTEFQPPEGLVFDSSSWFLAPANSIWIRVAHWRNSDCAYEQHSLGQDFSDLLMAGSQFKYVNPQSFVHNSLFKPLIINLVQSEKGPYCVLPLMCIFILLQFSRRTQQKHSFQKLRELLHWSSQNY